MLNINLDDFKALFNLHWCDFDGADGNQCFDLAQFWNLVLGGQPFTGATADLIYNQPQNIYTQVANTPNNFPVAGDIVVLNYPHVGIATGNNTDSNKFEMFEQNDPTNGSCQIKIYDYSGVIGWLHPNQLPENQQSLIDSLRQERDSNWNSYEADEKLLKKLNDLIDLKNTAISGYTGKIDTLEKQIEDLQTSLNSKTPIAEQLPECQKELEQSKSDVKAFNLQINSLNKTISGLSGTSYKTVSTKILVNEIIKRALQKVGLQ